MAKGGQRGGQGKCSAMPKRWPKVLTPGDETPQEKLPASSLPVDQREEPFLLKHAVMEASTWAEAHQHETERTQSRREIVESVLSHQEVAEFISRLTRKCAIYDQGERESGEIDVQVNLMSGASAFRGAVDSEMTVAELKQRLQADTGVKVGWQVLLLGDGLELDNSQKMSAYSGKQLQRLEIQLQVFKFRDFFVEAACGEDAHGATLCLLEDAQRDDYASSCVAAYNLGFNSERAREEQTISFKLLARTLPLQSACQLLVHAVVASSSELQHQAAVEFARLFHESMESTECLESACSEALISGCFSGSEFAHRLFQHLKQVRFPQRPLSYTGPQIQLRLRDPVEVGREYLEKYMDFGRSLPANWHYQTVTPIAGDFNLAVHIQNEARRAATMLRLRKKMSSMTEKLTWLIISDSAETFAVVRLSPLGLFPENKDMSDADVFCGIAEHPKLPAEYTRMALECAARLSGKSNSRALAAACWCAGHHDAAVREQALEVLQCVAQAGDLPAIQSMLQNWWGRDCHARRIGREMARSCTSEDDQL